MFVLMPFLVMVIWHQRNKGMKKNIIRMLVLLILIFLSSCSMNNDKSKIRFYNGTSDTEIYYGLKLGDAEYIGSLVPGTITMYYDTNEGTYNLKVRDSSRNWQTVFDGSTSVDSGKSYTVYISGSYSNSTLVWGIRSDNK